MMLRSLATVLLALSLTAGAAQAQQPAPQRDGCAGGFCAMADAPQEQAADIEAVEAEMKRQLSGPPPRQTGGMGMMGMCPCMRMMAMMRRGGMGTGAMPSMPGMQHPPPAQPSDRP